MNQIFLRIYHVEPKVTTLGPGIRVGLWLQGCPLNCPGCLVPDARVTNGGELVSLRDLLERFENLPALDGISVSGGEPFLQAYPVSLLLKELKRRRPELTVLVYSGYTFEQLTTIADSHHLLQQADLLIDGPYDKSRPAAEPWRGSENQRAIFLSDRIKQTELAAPQHRQIEFFIRTGGDFFMSGIPEPNLMARLKNRFFHDLT